MATSDKVDKAPKETKKLSAREILGDGVETLEQAVKLFKAHGVIVPESDRYGNKIETVSCTRDGNFFFDHSAARLHGERITPAGQKVNVFKISISE
jgi:hypothetical protein